jgi:hypothetical protein
MVVNLNSYDLVRLPGGGRHDSVRRLTLKHVRARFPHVTPTGDELDAIDTALRAEIRVRTRLDYALDDLARRRIGNDELSDTVRALRALRQREREAQRTRRHLRGVEAGVVVELTQRRRRRSAPSPPDTA